MNNYDFKLNPAYCLFNGVAIVYQSGTSIIFMIENMQNEILIQRLKKAFVNHLHYVQNQSDCPKEYKCLEKIEFRKGSRNELKKYVSSLYEDQNNPNSGAEKKDENTEEKLAFDKDKEEAAAIILLDDILSEARELKCSDIHIESSSVRYRVQGKLSKVRRFESQKCRELIQRIKLLSGMNVLKKNESQDGSFAYGREKPLFVRVSAMPLHSSDKDFQNESVVLRILDTSRIPLTLPLLGFNENQLEGIERLLEEKNGLILICGPTGSGKSTSAASMLLELSSKNCNQLKIISLENPPEYVIPYVSQIKTDEGNFNHILSHVFRQDPDVLMIGEIRDKETCEAAVRASLTGHLVIATMHSSSVRDAIYRLKDLGSDLNVISSVLRGIIVQEINYCNSKASLLADLALPKENFYELISRRDDEDLEDFFEHKTNALEVLVKTLGKENMRPKKYRADKPVKRKKTGGGRKIQLKLPSSLAENEA